MFAIGNSLKSNLNFKPKSFTTDNLVFRLHYRFTFWLLLIFCGMICIEEYNKEKIKCTHSDPTDSKKQLEHVISTFCFFMMTFTVPRHYNTSRGYMPFAGIGPVVKDDDVVKHTYYQWVPYVLALQAFSFYIPHYLWRTKENNRLKEIVSQFTFEQMIKEVKNDKDWKENSAMDNIIDSFPKRMKMYRSWLAWLVTCEVLNVLNLILQFYLTDLFLVGNFKNLGTHIYEHYGNEEYNPFDIVFPKVSKCTFQKYGPSGSLQTHDAVCILSLNIINEKMYLVLWYWYIFVFTASVLMVVHRILSWALYKTKIKYNTTIFQQEMMTIKPSKRDLLRIMEKYNYSEWFFLQTLATNLDGEVAVNLLEKLANTQRRDGCSSRSSSSCGFKKSNLQLSLLPMDECPEKEVC